MPDPLVVTISNWLLGLLKEKLKYVVFAAALSALAIWNPLNWQQYTHAASFITPHVWIAWLVFICCGLWLVISFSFWVLGALGSFIEREYDAHRFRKLFKKMPSDQAKILLKYSESASSTQTFIHADAALMDLEQKGIVTHISHVVGSDGLYGNWVDNWTYRLTPSAVAVLRQQSIQAVLQERAK